MIKPGEISEEVWRAGMSAYHKTLRKNPGLAWQTAAAEILNAWWEEVQLRQITQGIGHDAEGMRRMNVAERLFGDD